MSHIVFDLFTFREHKTSRNQDKLPNDITVAITFCTEAKILVKFLKNILRNKVVFPLRTHF